MKQHTSLKPADISVVIPCYNEERYVGLLLDDLVQQTQSPRQVIVADSRSTDKTISVVQHYAKRLPLEVTVSKIRTPGAARNAGARIATGDYIVFIDADSRLPKDALAQITNTIRNKPVDYISPLFATPGNHPFDVISIRYINRTLQNPATAKRFTPGVGMCMIVRRSLHEAIHGFDDTLLKENDLEYLERLKDAGASYTTIPTLFVEASNRRLIKDGRLVSLLNYMPRNSWLGKHVTYPLLKKLGKDKRYGIF